MGMYCPNCGATVEPGIGLDVIYGHWRFSVCSESCERAYVAMIQEEQRRRNDTLADAFMAEMRKLGATFVDTTVDVTGDEE